MLQAAGAGAAEPAQHARQRAESAAAGVGHQRTPEGYCEGWVALKDRTKQPNILNLPSRRLVYLPGANGEISPRNFAFFFIQRLFPYIWG